MRMQFTCCLFVFIFIFIFIFSTCNSKCLLIHHTQPCQFLPKKDQIYIQTVTHLIIQFKYQYCLTSTPHQWPPILTPAYTYRSLSLSLSLARCLSCWSSLLLSPVLPPDPSFCHCPFTFTRRNMWLHPISCCSCPPHSSRTVSPSLLAPHGLL